MKRPLYAVLLALACPAFASNPATDEYRIGDAWGKTPVTPEALRNHDEAFGRTAKATAQYAGSTAFYLGKFNGHDLMATNHHVQDSTLCGGAVTFPLLGNRSFNCLHVYGSWSDVDLSLFAIDVRPEDESLLAGVGQDFDFDAKFYPGQPLLTIGFGTAGNPDRQMEFEEDSDCVTFSSEFRYLGDPDQDNPEDYRVWSFANGCDASHGDSGSAFVDRDTGHVIGIIWTGATPKPPEVQSSAGLGLMMKNQDPKIWTELTYAVPAPKIGEYLDGLIGSGTLNADDLETLKEVRGHKVSKVLATVVADDYLDTDPPVGLCEIQFHAREDSTPSNYCSGTLIAPNRVLTASHCAQLLTDPDIVADAYCSGPYSASPVVGMARNPHFVNMNGFLLHDMAIFELDDRSSVRPVTLVSSEAQSQSLLAGAPSGCQLWGYGMDANGRVGTAHGAAFELRSAANVLKLIATDAPASVLFTGPNHADHGDSGGPVFCKDPQGALIQVAVTSQEMLNLPYSMHDPISDDLDWIRSTLALSTLPKLPATRN